MFVFHYPYISTKVPFVSRGIKWTIVKHLIIFVLHTRAYLKKTLSVLFIPVIICVELSAQNFLGISSSSYSGIHGVFLNPANSVDTRNKIYINLGAVGAEFQNNFITSNRPIALNSYRLRSVKRGNAYMNADLRGPAVQITLPEKAIGLSFGSRFRLFSSLNNTSSSVGNIIIGGTGNREIQNEQFLAERVDFNFGGYNEIYATFAQVIKNERSYFLKGGITLKKVSSNISLSLKGSNLDYQVNPLPPFGATQEVVFNNSAGSFFHARSGDFNLSLPWITRQLGSLNGVGNGFATDVGLVYEKRPDFARQNIRFKGDFMVNPLINKYTFRFGVSLTDIGFVRFSSSTNVEVGSGNGPLTVSEPIKFVKIIETDRVVQNISNAYSITPSTYVRAFNVLMPATLNIHADYLVREGFYLSVVLRQFLLRKTRIGPIGFSGISVIPRFERKYLEVAFPISLDKDYSTFNLGSTLRTGPFFVGLDNITGLIRIGDPRGVSVHSGISISIGHKLQKNQELNCPSGGLFGDFEWKNLFKR
ncbi:MAG: hypothetical protein ACI9IP_002840 [Arcticibacterium sp.]